MKKIVSRKNMLLLISACFFVLLYSYTTFYGVGSNDSAIFLTIGKFWSEGVIPYINLFDHKGPFGYFINMLGYKIFARTQGILFFQVISMFVSFFFLEKIAFLELKIKKKKMDILFLVFCFFSVIYSGGNMTEEYCLPFITCCMYYSLKCLNIYVNTGEINLKNKCSFIYGISLGVCFLTRITNAISILVGIFMIYIILIKEKKLILLLKSLVFFVFGFLGLFLPFAVYFEFNDCFF